MSDESTLRTIARHLGRAVEPLRVAVTDDDAFRSLSARLGFSAGSVPAAYQNLAAKIVAVTTAIETDNVPALTAALADLGTALGAGFPAPDGSAVSDIGRRLTDLLIVEYLQSTVPTVAGILRAIGVIQVTQTTLPGVAQSFIEVRLNYDEIPHFLSSPTEVVKAVFAWGAAEFSFEFVAGALLQFLGTRFDMELEQPQIALASGYFDDHVASGIDSALHVTFFETSVGGVPVEAAVKLIELPGLNPGFILQPVVPSHVDVTLSGNTRLTADNNVQQTFGLIVRPATDVTVRYPFDQGSNTPSATVAIAFNPPTPKVLLGSATTTRVEVAGAKAGVTVSFVSSEPEIVVALTTTGAKVVLEPGGTDGFMSTIMGNKPAEAPLDLTVRWSSRSGLSFGGSGKFEVTLDRQFHLGPIDVSKLHVAVSGRAAGAGKPAALLAQADADIGGKLGPVDFALQGVGVDFNLGLATGNLGPVNLDVGFKAPTGVGIAIKAGSVTGGGFLSFKDSTYSGALELKVYSVNVKAFGVIETKLPNGQSGFSFAIVISAEFNPIQLGLGFTLNGVGGIIGINRRIDQDALAKGVRTGSLEHLLFPHDVVHDAPQIIHDLQAILPPTEGRYVFGPIAKIGWGTPTIIEADLGIILELPGPVLALLGEVRALLPKKDKGVVTLNLSIAGVLDFPKKYFAINASLHDSKVGSYPISGDMAMRMTWGDNPTFALAVGGFNPAFQPPAGFPKLRRVAIDLGVSGNPSLTLQGYFALTSNTAQIGALAELRASGSGITLYGKLQFDALIVFSPFSFEVTLSAQVSIQFHGHGISVHLKGVLTGPSPWRVRGEVCVSILWWDACLSFDKSFGSAQKVELPSLNPWTGTTEGTATPEVLGLQKALQDPRNWTPEPPPGSLAVVSLVDTSADSQLFDPLGIAVVKQSVCPFNLQLQRFGSAKVSGTAKFTLVQAQLNNVTVDLAKIKFIKEPFAKAQFVDLKDAQKLSAPSFEPFDGAIRLPANDNATVPGSFAPKTVAYKTKVLGATAFTQHLMPSEHLTGMTRRSVTGLAGLRRVAARAYLDPTAQPRFEVDFEQFVVGNRLTFRSEQGGALNGTFNKLEASLALNKHLETNPDDVDVLQIFPKFEMNGR